MIPTIYIEICKILTLCQTSMIPTLTLTTANLQGIDRICSVSTIDSIHLPYLIIPHDMYLTLPYLRYFFTIKYNTVSYKIKDVIILAGSQGKRTPGACLSSNETSSDKSLALVQTQVPNPWVKKEQ